MKWVTRENAKVERIACPWLIRRFIDRDAEFLYVPMSEVMAVVERENAIPFDVPGVELGHNEGRCSFESILLKYGLTGDPALTELGRIIHAADIMTDIETALEGWGVMAIAHGFSLMFGVNDHRKLELEAPVYDALYAWCQHKLQEFRGSHLTPGRATPAPDNPVRK